MTMSLSFLRAGLPRRVTLVIAFWAVLAARSASPGEEVAVIYNLKMAPDSRSVAEHYAKQRGVPKQNLIGLSLPESEHITRRAFRDQFQRPLIKELENRKLVKFQEKRVPASEGTTAGVARLLTESKVRYLVLSYGVPLRILADAKLDEPIAEKLPEPLRRNEAAVDSELACLPMLERRASLTGPIQNPFFGTTNFASLHPTNGIFLVTRLDGPSPTVALHLVDKALAAETNGLWGRAYFDVRGITNGGYAKGDEWIRAAYAGVRRQGFETVLDEQGSTFPAWFPMPQIALYAGWYEGGVSGPFAREPVEFLPGAVAYHLHSYSASTIRNPKARWVGPFLAQGVTATLGCVTEPYLDLTPNVGVFFTYLISGLGCNFAEAAYVSQPVLSWQTTVIGDPLYRPMGRDPAALHAELERRKSEWLAWSYLRVVNLNLVTGAPTEAMINYLTSLPLTRESAVLSEKLGKLYRSARKPDLAIKQYRAALELKPSRNQAIEIQFALIELLRSTGQDAEVLEVYEAFFQANPDYPGILRFYQRALPLAKKLGDERLAEGYQKQIERLTPPPPAAAATQTR